MVINGSGDDDDDDWSQWWWWYDDDDDDFETFTVSEQPRDVIATSVNANPMENCPIS